MKKNLKKMVKKVCEVACIVGLTLAVNGVVDGAKDVQIQPVISAQDVDTQLTVKDMTLFEEMITESMVNSSLEVVSVDDRENGNIVIELSNRTSIVYDAEFNIISFAPIELGDWGLTFNNLDDALKCITQYAESVAPINSGVTVQAKNWVNDGDDENSDLMGNIVIEDGNKTIEISKEVYNDIEYGENADLKGGVYIENDDIISESELNHQVKCLDDFELSFNEFNITYSEEDDAKKYTIGLDNGFQVVYIIENDMFYVYSIDGNIKEFECINDTKEYLETINNDGDINDSEIEYTQEDYDKYLEYKQSLINEYGEDVYNLMNQEARIKNEEESFIHYMKYGK